MAQSYFRSELCPFRLALQLTNYQLFLNPKSWNNRVLQSHFGLEIL